MISEPYKIIKRYVAERSSASNDTILQELSGLEPLRDETDPLWDTDAYWNNEAYRFLALADLVGMRRLRSGVRLLLERACFGDPGETMRGLRHCSEAVFNPDWDGLAAVCLSLVESPRAGTRLWTVDQLTVLDDLAAESALRRALSDDIAEIRAIAKIGIERLERLKSK